MKVLVLFAFVGLCFASCSFQNANGEHWDLSPLTYSPDMVSPAAYSVADSQYTYYVNFCEDVSESIGNGACNFNGGAGACQAQSNTFFYDTGKSNTAQFVDYVSDGSYEIGVGITYTSGQPCAQGSRQTTVYVSCDYSVGTGYLYSASESAYCGYTLYFKSIYGCPSYNVSATEPVTQPESGSIGVDAEISLDVVIIVLLLVILAVLIVGLFSVWYAMKSKHESSAYYPLGTVVVEPMKNKQ